MIAATGAAMEKEQSWNLPHAAAVGPDNLAVNVEEETGVAD